MTSTTDHSGNGDQTANNSASDGRGRSRPKKDFNSSAKGVDEVEIKELVIDNDLSVFPKIERFFIESGHVRLMHKNKALQTRQLDTIDRQLEKLGKTLRIRGECEDGDLTHVAVADICLKDEKTMTASGAVKRREYEARIDSFETIVLYPLLSKYPKSEHPDLHKTLKGMKIRDLREHFRIDCMRNRYVVELPEELTGIKGKKFFAELILDDVAFVMDLPGRKEPLVYHRDLEVECEVLFKPCSYDANPEAARAFVSSPDLTKEEVDMGLTAIKMLLDQSSGHRLEANAESKAERGFTNLDRVLASIREYLAMNDQQPAHSNGVTSAFAIASRQVANDNAQPADNAAPGAPDGNRLHKHLPRSMAHVMHERPIARRPML